MISVKHFINWTIYSTCTHEIILGSVLICLIVVLFIKGDNFNKDNLIISRIYTFYTTPSSELKYGVIWGSWNSRVK